MKKFLFFLMLAQTLLCFAKYQVPAYLNSNNFSTIERYLKDSINRLDPIEGIYNAQLARETIIYDRIDEEKSGSFTFRCAIYRNSENSFIMALESFDSDLKIVNSIITRIGDTQIYNIYVEYPQMFFYKEEYKTYKKNAYISISYYHSDKKLSSNTRVVIESQFAICFELNFKGRFHYIMGSAPIYDNKISVQDNYSLIKEYPTSSMYDSKTVKQEKSLWTGTGFAFSNGYIVTNHHVINEAKTISIKGVNGDLNNGYTAEVVTTDKKNDIAVLKINDNRFEGFDAIPYSVTTKMADVGEEVFVLGYPLTQALGNEIKLTNGIISSRTGYQGDIATYQISAPVQPGNSGGPMFDSKGNVIGIVVAGVPGAENVGYAIKTSYLKILNESAGLDIKLPTNNTLSTLSLSEKVKLVKNFVYYIECSK